MRLLISIFLSAFFGLNGFTDPYSNSEFPEFASADTLVHMERTRCYGTCPAYEITIHENGRIVFAGKEYVEHKGKAESEISQENLNELLQIIRETNFVEIPSDPKCESRMTDHPSVFLTIKIDVKRNSITHYLGCRGFEHEDDLFRLEAAIDSLSGVNRWIEGQ